MGCNGLPEKLSLRLGESHGDGLGFDLARPAPVAWMVGGNTSMGEPSQSGKFSFESLKARLEFLAVRGL